MTTNAEIKTWYDDAQNYFSRVDNDCTTNYEQILKENSINKNDFKNSKENFAQVVVTAVIAKHGENSQYFMLDTQRQQLGFSEENTYSLFLRLQYKYSIGKNVPPTNNNLKKYFLLLENDTNFRKLGGPSSQDDGYSACLMKLQTLLCYPHLSEKVGVTAPEDNEINDAARGRFRAWYKSKFDEDADFAQLDTQKSAEELLKISNAILILQECSNELIEKENINKLYQHKDPEFCAKKIAMLTYADKYLKENKNQFDRYCAQYDSKPKSKNSNLESLKSLYNSLLTENSKEGHDSIVGDNFTVNQVDNNVKLCESCYPKAYLLYQKAQFVVHFMNDLQNDKSMDSLDDFSTRFDKKVKPILLKSPDNICIRFLKAVARIFSNSIKFESARKADKELLASTNKAGFLKHSNLNITDGLQKQEGSFKIVQEEYLSSQMSVC